jgi:hypothetical protein
MDELTTKRTTTSHDRYQICDPICGQVETATSLAKALRIAQGQQRFHSDRRDNPSVHATRMLDSIFSSDARGEEGRWQLLM